MLQTASVCLEDIDLAAKGSVLSQDQLEARTTLRNQRRITHQSRY